MRRQRQAKIVATLGPATSSVPRIKEVFQAGADVFRFNFSHGTYEDHKRCCAIVRKIEKESGRPISILMDLQGPKLRIGKFGKESVRLQAGAPFRLDMLKEPGNTRRVSLPHPEVFDALVPGTDLLLDDGKIRLRVVLCDHAQIDTQVIIGGELSDHKGINIPEAILNVSSLTEKDHKDLRYGLELGVDWVALSFVQKSDDIAEVCKLVAGRASVMAKLERPQALDHLAEIIDLSDGIMIARGDLGIEFSPEEIPVLQKQIILACRQAGKPVVVATQMLDSMVHTPAPTRAEASDVATAIYDGADAVMLSAETAIGDYPVETVSIMDRIIRKAEQNHFYGYASQVNQKNPKLTTADAISFAAAQAASAVSAAAIVSFTFSGSTALRAAHERPQVPIISITPKLETARKLALVWGIHAVPTADIHNINEMIRKAVKIAKQEEFVISGERLTVMAGIPFGTPGATNILHILWVK